MSADDVQFVSQPATDVRFGFRLCENSDVVKTGKAQCEKMLSALPLRADIAQCNPYVRFVQ